MSNSEESTMQKDVTLNLKHPNNKEIETARLVQSFCSLENKVRELNNEIRNILTAVKESKLSDKELVQLMKESFENMLEERKAEELDNELLTWNHKKSSNVAIFSEDKCSATVIEKAGIYSYILGSKAVERFTVLIDQEKYLRVGFITDEKQFKEKLSSFEYHVLPQYTLASFDGGILGEGKVDNWDRKKAKFVAGDYITIEKEGSNIRILKNKENLGVAFTNVKEGPLFPLLVAISHSPAVSLVI